MQALGKNQFEISLKSVLKLEECLKDQGNPVPTGKEQYQRKD